MLKEPRKSFAFSLGDENAGGIPDTLSVRAGYSVSELSAGSDTQLEKMCKELQDNIVGLTGVTICISLTFKLEVGSETFSAHFSVVHEPEMCKLYANLDCENWSPSELEKVGVSLGAALNGPCTSLMQLGEALGCDEILFTVPTQGNYKIASMLRSLLYLGFEQLEQEELADIYEPKVSENCILFSTPVDSVYEGPSEEDIEVSEEEYYDLLQNNETTIESQLDSDLVASSPRGLTVSPGTAFLSLKEVYKRTTPESVGGEGSTDEEIRSSLSSDASSEYDGAEFVSDFFVYGGQHSGSENEEEVDEALRAELYGTFSTTMGEESPGRSVGMPSGKLTASPALELPPALTEMEEIPAFC